MTTHRRYFFEHPDPYPGPGHGRVLDLLQLWCDTYAWYSEPVVEGAPFERLSFSVRVWGRDQWWCHHRAMMVAQAAAHAAGVPCPEPTWEKLPPHENRGRYRSSAP